MSTPTLVIEPVPGGLRAGLFQGQGKLRQFWLMPDPLPGLYPGAVVTGSIKQRNPAMGSLTVEVPGQGEVQVPAQGVKQDLGQLRVEIIAAPQIGIGTGRHKPARGTAQISAAGRYLVLRDPKGKNISKSSRLHADAAKGLMAELQHESGSWVVRQNAVEVEPALVLEEAAQLTTSYPSRERAPTNLAMRIYQEMACDPADCHLLLDERLADQNHELSDGFAWLDEITIERQPGERVDLDRCQFELEQKVVTFDGGQLCFEPTEALVAIDVDLASTDKWRAGLLEASRQIQLRNLSGSIVIDLPRGPDAAEVKTLMTGYLEQAGVAATVHGLSRGGLLELSISRRWPMLHEVIATLPSQPAE